MISHESSHKIAFGEGDEQGHCHCGEDFSGEASPGNCAATALINFMKMLLFCSLRQHIY